MSRTRMCMLHLVLCLYTCLMEIEQKTPDSVNIAHWGVLWGRMGEAAGQAGEELARSRAGVSFPRNYNGFIFRLS